MFNYGARQLFVIHPYQGGGSIFTSILSLDPGTAALNLKKLTVDEKLTAISSQLADPTTVNAHVYGLMHFMTETYRERIRDANSSDRYVHHGHFYELFSDESQHELKKMSNKIAIGINYTEDCVKQLRELSRGNDYNQIDHYYQMWIYNNLKTLLPTYFNIDCFHTINFSDLLNLDKFLDHLKFCSDELDLEINETTAKDLIIAWHKKLKVPQ